MCEQHPESEVGKNGRCRRCWNDYQNAWYHAHRDSVLAGQHTYNVSHSAQHIARSLAWKRANRAAVHDQRALRRARQHQATSETVSRLAVLELADGICGICGGDVDPGRFHLDHIVPLSKGGAHTYENIQLAHPACNHRKADRLDFQEGAAV